MTRIPLVMKVWAGNEPHDMTYITRSIPSLLASRLPPGVEIVIYDDASPCRALQRYLAAVAERDPRVRVVRGDENKGPNLAQQDLFTRIADDYADAPCFINVDDDVVYHRDWLTHLADAWARCEALGLSGVFTALNMPYRCPHAVLRAAGRTYLIKWKQPALNWLIPRGVYTDIGPFRDEGIAYDTVYSHWMRLKHYAVICLCPSYVQNIGLLGAYATDDTTTSCDFVGEGAGRVRTAGWIDKARYRLRRLPADARRLLDPAADQIAPVRWGTEFVHEGRTRGGQSIAMFSFDDAVRLGWDREAAARRVETVRDTDPGGAAAILALRRNRGGTPVWVECDWSFAPNLRECRALSLGAAPRGAALFTSLLEQLAPLHARGVTHNKVRQDNVYVSHDRQQARLAWLGTEPCPGVPLGADATTGARLSGALNRWATPATRETCAVRYLEAVAPELLHGDTATPRSDVFAAAAVTLLGAAEPVETWARWREVRARWASARGADGNLDDPRVRALLPRCLASDPRSRPADAREALRLLAAQSSA